MRQQREERKLVTVLFADVTGSTALGETLDPEDVRALMSRYYQHARRVITEHGGTLEKFIGDAVMAIFGLPQAHGNDAERALAAALALREAVTGDAVLAAQIELRIGVNTGDVVAAADLSGGDFLVTGDAVNVTARLQAHADQGEILAGSRTELATDAAFVFGEARRVEVKGKREPLTVFPVLGTRPARRAVRPPLVGRRQDLTQLVLLRDRAVEERRPQLISIVAPAGTGKTRLLEEALARLDPAEKWQVATARCVPYGQSLTYWPLHGLLHDFLGDPVTVERVAAAFAAGGYAHEDAERLAGLVLVPLGLASAESAEREALQVAAVVGRTFRPGMLQAVLASSRPAEVDAAVEGLLARDLIVPAGSDSTYAFRHMLFRDVAYGTLTRAERVRLHTAVARCLETFAANRVDEFVELIAYHYREAVQLARQSAVPLGVQADTTHAVRFLVRAGELAGRAGAVTEVRDYLQSAIELAPTADHPRLYEALGDGLASGDLALAAYRQALEAWQADATRTPLTGVRLLRKLLTILVRWHSRLSEQVSREEMAALCAQARQLAEEAEDEYELARLRSLVHGWYESLGVYWWDRSQVVEDLPARRSGVRLTAETVLPVCSNASTS